MKVVKRDKTVEQFQIEKIEIAIQKAFKSCEKEPDYRVIDCIRGIYDESKDETIHVEDIQDNVEKCLMDTDKDVAKSYIIYRYNHKLIRENKDKLYKDITKKLLAVDVQNQNLHHQGVQVLKLRLDLHHHNTIIHLWNVSFLIFSKYLFQIVPKYLDLSS